jgi:hypothetical protein
MWAARDHDVIRVPQDRREAVRWALVVATPCAVLGLAAGWLIGWRKARCGD